MTDEQDSEVQFEPRPFSGGMSDTLVWDPLEAANIGAGKLMMHQATSAIGTQPKPQATSAVVTQLMRQITSVAGTPLTSQATLAAGTQQTQLYVMVDSVVQMSREPIRIKYQMEVVSNMAGASVPDHTTQENNASTPNPPKQVTILWILATLFGLLKR